MEKAPSSGKTTAIGSGATGSLIIITMYISKHFGLEDMTPEVATAFVTIAVMLWAGLMHTNQRKQEKKETTT